MPDSASILVPGATVITIGNDQYPVQKFVLAKGMHMLAALTEVAEKADIAAVVSEGQQFGWIPAMVRGLPKLVQVARPQVFKVMALALMPNKRYFELIETEADIDAELKAEAKKLATNEALDFDKMMEILQVGYDNIGLDSLKSNFTKLLAMVPGTPAADPDPEVATETPGSS